MTTKIKKIIVWLAGLLSTDGVVNPTFKTACKYAIFSKDKDWLELIQKRLSEIRLSSKIAKIKITKGRFSHKPYYSLLLHDPEEITNLLKKYAEGYMIPRKWKIVQTRYPEKRLWRNDEITFIQNNWKELTDKKMAKKINRSIDSVRKKRQEINLRKKPQRRWSNKELIFLKENYKEMTDRKLAKKLDKPIYTIQNKRKLIGLRKR
jgi:hypothetical protein